MNFNLDKHDTRPLAQEGVDMPLLDPAGQVTGVVLRVRGYDSRIYKETVEAQLRRRTEMLPRKLSDADAKLDFYEELASLVAGWTGLSRGEGDQPFEHSPANAVKLLQEFDYIAEQVRRFAGNRRNFLPGSAKT